MTEAAFFLLGVLVWHFSYTRYRQKKIVELRCQLTEHIKETKELINAKIKG